MESDAEPVPAKAGEEPAAQPLKSRPDGGVGEGGEQAAERAFGKILRAVPRVSYGGGKGSESPKKQREIAGQHDGAQP